jgi:hypothetical protein
VLAVWVDGEFRPAPDDAYVRAETVKLSNVPHGKIDTREQKDEAVVSKDLDGFHKIWKKAAKDRRRSIGHFDDDNRNIGKITGAGDEITSGWNWDKYDEGINVSESMKDPKKRKPYEGLTEQLDILSANYATDQEPIAYMVIEVRNDHLAPVPDDHDEEARDDHDEDQVRDDYDDEASDDDRSYMYIRWLIAHPEKGGGASKLVQKAKDRLNEQDEWTELRVESALSAVGWYESMGFVKKHPGKNVVEKRVGYADTELVYKKGT